MIGVYPRGNIMKVTGYAIGILVVLMGLGLLVNVNAEVSYDHSYTDASGDVVPSQNDDIDLISFSSEKSGDEVLIKLQVVGEFNAITITVVFAVDGLEYVMTYSTGIVVMVDDNSVSYMPAPTIAMDEDTATFTINKSDVEASTSFVLIEVNTLDNGFNSDQVETGSDPGDDDTDDDDDDPEYNDDEMYAPDEEYENSNDPATETPTDLSISVDIESFDFDYTKGDTHEEWSEEMAGTTSGSVFTCAFTKVFYLKDGSTSGECSVQIEWTTGPYNLPKMTMTNTEMQQYFKGMGDEGADDWSQWEEYYWGKAPVDESDGDRGSCVDMDEVDYVMIFVRAFSDEDFNNWNQDSMDITDYYKGAAGDDDDTDDDDTSGDGNETDEDEEDSPGFGMLIISASLIAAIFMIRRRK